MSRPAMAVVSRRGWGCRDWSGRSTEGRSGEMSHGGPLMTRKGTLRQNMSWCALAVHSCYVASSKDVAGIGEAGKELDWRSRRA